jgi:hypothetical protein
MSKNSHLQESYAKFLEGVLSEEAVDEAEASENCV